MNDRTRFLKQETVSARNKIMRKPIPNLDTYTEETSLPERRALALYRILDSMPIFIGEGELIVGTRTYLRPHNDNLDGHDVFKFRPDAFPRYVTDGEIKMFGGDFSGCNKRHYTPDLSLLLTGGIDALIAKAQKRLEDTELGEHNREFLRSLILSYRGLSRLISRYADEAERLSGIAETDTERDRLNGIAEVCRKVAHSAPSSFREAIQLLWLGHLTTIIESFYFVSYGRLDVILAPYLGDTPRDEALELIECLLLKMYDQADLYDHSSIVRHEGQLVVTLGGVLPNGESAVSEVTMLFLEAIEGIMLPDPEFNLRISKKNPKEFLDRAARLTVKGANFVSYYNDDLFVESLIGAGLSPEDARDYAFDLCQDINIPGRNDSWCVQHLSMIRSLLAVLEDSEEPESFEELIDKYKSYIDRSIDSATASHNSGYHQMTLYRDGRYDEYFAGFAEGKSGGWFGRHPMCPLPYLSGLYHGTVEAAVDMIYDPYPIKDKGAMVGTAVEAVNSLAAIKRVVFEDREFTLADIRKALSENFEGDSGRIIRARLKAAPKWGNDDPFVDSIAKDVIEHALKKYRTKTLAEGGRLLTGIHQPHPVTTGRTIGATPDGRAAGEPVSVTMTPASGTLKNGATAALRSAAIFDTSLIQWNYCFMINYYASAFSGEGGIDIFKRLLTTYFDMGGMQHQPNVMDPGRLKEAQLDPQSYRDLIVRLWGVSAHFVDLPREMQDEIIARLS